MSFELPTLTKAKLVDIIVLSQKNRQPDENPGAKLSFELNLGNDTLAMFDGRLKAFLFTKNASAATEQQATLEGVPAVSDMPSLSSIGQKVGTLHWELELTGYTLTIDSGLGGPSNMVIGDSIVSNFRLQPKEGGTFLGKFDLESSDITEAAFGRLAKLKSRELQVLLAAPEVSQQDIEGKPAKRSKVIDGTVGHPALKDDNKAWPFGDKGKKNAPAQPDATDAFVAAHGEPSH